MSGPTRLGDVLARLRRKRASALRPRERAVFEAFGRALSEGNGGRARPVSLRRGILRVEVGSAARLHELSAFAREACVERTNALLGAPLVRRIE
ncbi:MAG TPA: DciA family protein, partial [Planctomycetota bacterium]|nr:DciA family protein [Planctomycetota bacterium]